ncbi:MAG: RraA family protein [Firmicutes bacterium]|jgi:RraA family protein|nr:RraA family protein [Bacillota bacterium]
MSNLGFRIIQDINRPSKELLEAFRGVQTAFIGDAVNRFFCVDSRIKLVNKGNLRMVGSAFTVRTRIADNLMVHKALDLAKPGDVIVIDAEGDMNVAIFGDHMTTAAMLRGLAGYVVNGCIRDVETIETMDFPVFAKGVSPRGPYKDGPGEINVPICCGGVVVKPGDIVVGDRDGVAVIPLEEAENVLAKVKDIVEQEKMSTIEIDENAHLPWSTNRPWIDKILREKGCSME